MNYFVQVNSTCIESISIM